MNHLRHYLLLPLLAGALFSCDTIAPEDRLIPEEQQIDPTQGRSLLVEEFSGVKCINCPIAQEVIHSIATEYGAKVIPVSIHGVASEIGTPTNHPLYSTDGAAYAKRFLSLQTLPQAVFSRTADKQGTLAFASYSLWKGMVRERRLLDQLLKLDLKAQWQGDKQIAIECQAQAVAGFAPKSGLSIQFYLLEDGIIAPQESKSGKIESYVHNHILRQALNGTWGESYTLGSPIRKTYTTTAQIVNQKMCSVVGFVFDTQSMEVYEAIAIRL